MTIEQLRQMYSAKPFRAFDLHLADGRTVGVEHPELLAISPSGRTILVGHADDTFETIDLLLVVSLKPRPEGSHRRRPRS
ncbi:MAG TPA: hypothetical protein VMF69_15670 [Gemmataceae bacterium]|nr:hypothetical protein [Gemmataceae bacterium]